MVYDNYIASVGKYSGTSMTFTIGGIAEPSDKTFRKDESTKDNMIHLYIQLKKHMI